MESWGKYATLVSWIVRDKYIAINQCRHPDYTNEDIEGGLGKVLKLNLNPLSNRKADIFKFGQDLEFNSKKGDYHDWRMNHRFPNFGELVIEFPSKVIICAQLGNKDDYEIAFGLYESDIQHRAKLNGK